MGFRQKLSYAKVSRHDRTEAGGLSTAWLHYLVGVSVNNIIKLLSVVCRFNISPGRLTQAWKNLSILLEPIYNKIGRRISTSAVLNADETRWLLNGITHWLWCFTKEFYCYETFV